MQAVSSAIGRGAGRLGRPGQDEDPAHAPSAEPAPQPREPDPLRTDLERVFATTLADCREPRVAVLAGDSGTGLHDLLTDLRPRAHVALGTWDLEGSELHVTMAAAGPLDLLVDRSGHRASPARLGRLIGYVRRGGVMVAELHPPLRGPTREKQRAAYAARVAEALGAADTQVSLSARHVTVVNGAYRRPVIRERDIGWLLELRPDLGRVLELHPAQHVTARGTVTMTAPDPRHPPLREWMAPTRALREYYDAVSTPGAVVTSGDVVLPDTFRHFYKPTLLNQWLSKERVQWFAGAGEAPPTRAEPAPENGPRPLAGSYFHLDHEVRGHFGHTVTEVLGKVWGWRAAKRADPSLKALVHANRRDAPTEWELTMLEAAGIPRDDVVFTRDPVRVERLVGATSMFGNPQFAHPDLLELWQGIADRLETSASADVPERIFVSRRPGRRPCLNLAEVEAFFEDLGYRVVYPEDYSLGDQVRLFRRSRSVAGFAGSGLFGLMWASEPKPVTMLVPDRYPARNEFLINGLVGHDVAVAWAPALTVDPATGKRHRGVNAPFTVDLERDGEFLADAATRAAS